MNDMKEKRKEKRKVESIDIRSRKRKQAAFIAFFVTLPIVLVIEDPFNLLHILVVVLIWLIVLVCVYFMILPIRKVDEQDRQRKRK